MFHETALDALLTYGLAEGLYDFITPATWSGDGTQVIFSAKLGDSRNLWQVPISPKSWQVTGPPQRLTFGTSREAQASVAAGGRMVFSSLLSNTDAWSLPIDANQGKVSGEIQPLIQNAASDAAFDLSADGRKLVFLSNRSGTMDVWLKNLDSGRESPVTLTPSDEWWPQMTPDGSRISYEVRERDDKPVIYVLPASGGVAERVCEDCGGPWDWSPDGQSFFYRIPDRQADSPTLLLSR
jgi:Tol biopolymer transport system component